MKYKSLEECLKNYYGRDTKINTCFPVGGGDINEAFCLLLSNDEKVFVKTNRAERLGFFEAEEAGLAAIKYFSDNDRKTFVRFLDRLPDLLDEPDKPSLLHGDLWSGNFIVGNDGDAWLIDPAVYVGHHEADLAMTELFGGFREDFYRGYNEVNPVDAGYKDRKDIYNLYHLLNHLNLFGSAYLSGVLRIVNHYA